MSSSSMELEIGFVETEFLYFCSGRLPGRRDHVLTELLTERFQKEDYTRQTQQIYSDVP